MHQNKRGIVMIMAVIMAGAAMVLASALVAATSSRLKNVGQTHSFEQAFFIADAGIQRARAQVSTDGGISSARLGPDGYSGTADDGIFAFSNSVPFAGGAYDVRAMQDVVLPPGIAVNPDNVLVVISTGTYNNVTRVIEAGILYQPSLTLPGTGDVDAALGFYGTNGYLSMLGAPLKVDGRDWDVPVTFDAVGHAAEGAVNLFKPPAPSSVYAAEAVSVSAHNSAIYGAVPPNDPERIKIGGGRHDEDYWRNFASQIAPYADHTITGDTTIAGNTSLGTREDPKIIVVESGGNLHGSGTINGAGILIVHHDGALRITGDLRFEGLVIGFGNGANTILGSGNPKIFGAVVCIEDDTAVSFAGSPNIRYSSQALGNLSNLNVGNSNLGTAWWREIR